jgi:dihydrofolate reductase
MGNVIVFTHLTLDGVMQAPARPDEDRRGGFQHGGWGESASADPAMGQAAAAAGKAKGTAILLGRRTYEDFASVWPNRPADEPFVQVINQSQKYVVSRTLTGPLAWQNSALLQGEAADTVARLKRESEGDLVVLGSGVLVQSLMERNLIDRYILLIHPLVLGSGRRLFEDGGTLARLRLVESTTTATGVIIATYAPAEPAR